MIEVGDVVTIHERGDHDDRASGRVVRLFEGGGVGCAEVELDGFRRREFRLLDLVRFGLERGDDSAPWAPGQAVILLDSYENGVQAGQIGRVIEVSNAVTRVRLLVRARGPSGYLQGWVVANRVHRIPS